MRIFFAFILLLETIAYGKQLPPPILTGSSTINLPSGAPRCRYLNLSWREEGETSQAVQYNLYRDGVLFKNFSKGGLNLIGVDRLQDNAEHAFSMSSIDSTGEKGLTGNILIVKTPHCSVSKNLNIKFLLVSFSDFKDLPMPNYPWNAQVLEKDYLSFKNLNGEFFSFSDWVQKVTYNQTSVNLSFSEEKALPHAMRDYCQPTDGSAFGFRELGYNCNIYNIIQDSIAVHQIDTSQYQNITLFVKGMGAAGFAAGLYTVHSAHWAHSAALKPKVGQLTFDAFAHELGHTLGLDHSAGTRASCLYPKNLFDISKQCLWDRYGGSTVMGTGNNAFSSEERRLLGVLKDEQILKVQDFTAKNITLENINSPTTGIKQIQIQGLPSQGWFKETYLFMEYRVAEGINATTNSMTSIPLYLKVSHLNNSGGDADNIQLGLSLNAKNNKIDFGYWGFSIVLKQLTPDYAVVTVKKYTANPDEFHSCSYKLQDFSRPQAGYYQYTVFPRVLTGKIKLSSVFAFNILDATTITYSPDQYYWSGSMDGNWQPQLNNNNVRFNLSDDTVNHLNGEQTPFVPLPHIALQYRSPRTDNTLKAIKINGLVCVPE